MLTNQQTRHHATHKVAVSLLFADDHFNVHQGFEWVCMGMHGYATHSLHYPKGYSQQVIILFLMISITCFRYIVLHSSTIEFNTITIIILMKHEEKSILLQGRNHEIHWQITMRLNIFIVF